MKIIFTQLIHIMIDLILRYYFQLEFSWNKTWYSNEGFRRPIIRASNWVLSKEYVDYTLLEEIFLHSRVLKDVESTKLEIERIRTQLEQSGSAYHGNEHVGLEIKTDFSRPFDNLGTDDGIEGPLNWNIATPEHLQYIPTREILQLFDDWLDFLKTVEDNPPKFALL